MLITMKSNEACVTSQDVILPENFFRPQLVSEGDCSDTLETVIVDIVVKTISFRYSGSVVTCSNSCRAVVKRNGLNVKEQTENVKACSHWATMNATDRNGNDVDLKYAVWTFEILSQQTTAKIFFDVSGSLLFSVQYIVHFQRPCTINFGIRWRWYKMWYFPI